MSSIIIKDHLSLIVAGVVLSTRTLLKTDVAFTVMLTRRHRDSWQWALTDGSQEPSLGLETRILAIFSIFRRSVMQGLVACQFFGQVCGRFLLPGVVIQHRLFLYQFESVISHFTLLLRVKISITRLTVIIALVVAILRCFIRIILTQKVWHRLGEMRVIFWCCFVSGCCRRVELRRLRCSEFLHLMNSVTHTPHPGLLLHSTVVRSLWWSVVASSAAWEWVEITLAPTIIVCGGGTEDWPHPGVDSARSVSKLVVVAGHHACDAGEPRHWTTGNYFIFADQLLLTEVWRVWRAGVRRWSESVHTGGVWHTWHHTLPPLTTDHCHHWLTTTGCWSSSGSAATSPSDLVLPRVLLQLSHRLLKMLK